MSIQGEGTSGGEHSALHVSGHASLDGTLEIAWSDNGSLLEGNSITVVTMDSRSGEFACVSGPLGDQFGFVASYSDQEVQATLRRLGDINFDGIVDASDAGIMFSTWGDTDGGWQVGNFNCDNQVDAADASIMFSAWTGDTHSVPEPGCLMPFLFAAVLAHSKRGRKGSAEHLQ